MKRFDARNAVIQALKEKGLYKGMRDNPMSLGICSRSKDVIEPLLKPQWWVNCKGMAEQAIKVEWSLWCILRQGQAVETGELEIIPPNHRDTWFRWLSNIQVWEFLSYLIILGLVYLSSTLVGTQMPCILGSHWRQTAECNYCNSTDSSKQSDDNQSWVVGRNVDEALSNARKKFPDVAPEKITVEQDPDVLDTWFFHSLIHAHLVPRFSSALFPFSVFGWPNETEDLKAFYPTSLLETGHDILFFWVARMVMMGLYLTKKLPFRQVHYGVLLLIVEGLLACHGPRCSWPKNE